MWDTGAWWKILPNSNKPRMLALNLGGCDQQTSAGDLVSRYSFGQLGDVDLYWWTPLGPT